LDDAGGVLAEAEETLLSWAAVAEQAWRDGEDIAAALERRFASALEGVDPAQREKLETLNGVHSNAAGFRRWLETRSGAPTSAEGAASASPGRASPKIDS
jgi:hypothetical protein